MPWRGAPSSRSRSPPACRVEWGARWERLVEGRAEPADLEPFPALDEALRLTSICGLGQVVLNPFTSVQKHFPDEVAARLDAR